MAAVRLPSWSFKSYLYNRDGHEIPNVLLCIKCHQNRMMFRWDWRFYDFEDGVRPPSWICEIWSLYCVTSPCYSASRYKFNWNRTIGCWGMAKTIFNIAAFRHLEFKKMVFSHVTFTEYAVVYQISSKSDDVSLRWRFDDFQDGGCPPTWILGLQEWFP